MKIEECATKGVTILTITDLDLAEAAQKDVTNIDGLILSLLSLRKDMASLDLPVYDAVGDKIYGAWMSEQDDDRPKRIVIG